MDFTKVDQLRDALKAMRPLNDAELKRLREEFIIENTYDSNAIEGSTLTLRETALILQEGITIAEKPVKEHLEAIGHRDAFEYILTLADAGTPLTERVIKDFLGEISFTHYSCDSNHFALFRRYINEQISKNLTLEGSQQ